MMKKSKYTSTKLIELQNKKLEYTTKIYDFIVDNPKSTIKDISQHFDSSSSLIITFLVKLLSENLVSFETVKK